MPSFAYSAINSQGVELSGEIQAADLAAARDALRGNGLLAQRLEEITSAVASSGGSFLGIKAKKGVKSKSLQIFSRQFATMIEAGLSVVTALVILEQQTEDVGARRDHRRRARAGGRRRAALRGDRGASGCVLAPLHRDGRGRRGCRCPRRRARPRRDPDREGREDQAPRQGRDDLPVGRDDVRVPRAHRSPDVPRAGVREDLRPARRAAAEADPDHPAHVERAALPVVPRCPDPGRRLRAGRPRRRHLLLQAVEEDRQRPRRVGHLQAADPDADRRASSARSRWRASRAPCPP